MNETCDRCPGTKAVYRVTKGKLELLLCGHCGVVHHLVLAAQGWEISPVSSTAGAPQHDQSSSFQDAWPDRE